MTKRAPKTIALPPPLPLFRVDDVSFLHLSLTDVVMQVDDRFYVMIRPGEEELEVMCSCPLHAATGIEECEHVHEALVALKRIGAFGLLRATMRPPSWLPRSPARPLPFASTSSLRRRRGSKAD